MAIENLDKFTRRMVTIGEELPKKVVKIVRDKTIIDLTRRLVFKTPVDTGRARMNWQPAKGTPTSTELDLGEDFEISKAEANSIVLSYAAQVRKTLDVFDIYFISNHLPYIEVLNEGHSDQAPEGWIDNAINETVQGLRQA